MASVWDDLGTPVPQNTVNSSVSDPWAAVGAPVDSAPAEISGSPPAPGKGRIDPIRPNTFTGRVRDAVTGESTTEFPDALEFGPALARGGVRPEDLERIGAFDLSGVNRSAVTPDSKAQLDILRRNIPGLETTQDRFGNIMLRAPQLGVNEWAYLNRPGASGRDVDELATQTLATLPALGFAGRGGNTVRQAAARGFVGLGAGELTKDALAIAAGSEQDVDLTRAAVTAGLGAVTAPGVPSAIVSRTADTVRAAAQPVTGYFRSATMPSREAERRVAESFVADATGGGARLTPEQGQHLAANRLQIADAAQGLDQVPGGQARIMDVGGERTRALARSAANTSPEARGTLESVINPRFETQSERTSAFLDAVIPGPTAQQSREALQELAATARAPFYEASFREGAGGVRSPVLDRLIEQSPAIRRAMEAATTELQNRSAAGRLTTAVQGRQGYTLEFWDQVKRSLQDDFNNLSQSGRRSEAGNIGGILDRLVGALDQAVPSYSQARGVAMGIFRAQDALEAGRNFVSSKISNRAAEDALQTMTLTERDLFARGFVERFIENVGRTGDRRNLMNTIANSPDARARIETALGPRAARELEAFVRAERVLDLARSAVQGNSTTARQLVELGLAGAAGVTVAGFDPTNPVAWLVAVLTKQGARKLHSAIDTRVATEVAEMLVSRDPALIRRGLQRISSGPMFRALRDFDRRASGVGRAEATVQAGTAVSPDKAPANAMAGNQDTGNAMAPQAGTQDAPIRVRTRADVERAPRGAYVVDESGKVYQRK